VATEDDARRAFVAWWLRVNRDGRATRATEHEAGRRWALMPTSMKAAWVAVAEALVPPGSVVVGPDPDAVDPDPPP